VRQKDNIHKREPAVQVTAPIFRANKLKKRGCFGYKSPVSVEEGGVEGGGATHPITGSLRWEATKAKGPWQTIKPTPAFHLIEWVGSKINSPTKEMTTRKRNDRRSEVPKPRDAAPKQSEAKTRRRHLAYTIHHVMEQ